MTVTSCIFDFSFISIIFYEKKTEQLRARSLRVCKHGCDVLDSRVYFIKLFNKSNRALFFAVYIASSKHAGAGTILESYTNPRGSRGFALLSPILPTLLVSS